MTPTPSSAANGEAKLGQALLQQEIIKSYVRVVVTYSLTAAYILANGLVLCAALFNKEAPSQLALGLLSGLSSAALGVIGFWFGGRNERVDNLQNAAPSANKSSLDTASSADPQAAEREKKAQDLRNQLQGGEAPPPPPGNRFIASTPNERVATIHQQVFGVPNPPAR